MPDPGRQKAPVYQRQPGYSFRRELLKNLLASQGKKGLDPVRSVIVDSLCKTIQEISHDISIIQGAVNVEGSGITDQVP